MSDCSLIGSLTNAESREEVIRRFEELFNLSPLSAMDVIWPRTEPPGLEGRDAPFLLLSVVDVSREQMEIGGQGYITTKFIDIQLWIKEYTGAKSVDEFKDFTDSLGLTVSNGIDYGPVNPMKSLKHKGWDVHPVALPFRF